VSERVTCEHCGKPGQRRIGHVAPEGWWFGSFTLSPDGDHDPGDTLVVHACSKECRDALWTMQEGHKWDSIERRIDVASEIRRYAAHVIAGLREQVRRIRIGTYEGAANSGAFAGSKVAALLEGAADHLESSAENEVEALQSPSLSFLDEMLISLESKPVTHKDVEVPQSLIDAVLSEDLTSVRRRRGR